MKIAIVGEFNKNFRPHVATNEAIEHSKRFIDMEFETEWVSTEFVEANLQEVVGNFQGFWDSTRKPLQKYERSS